LKLSQKMSVLAIAALTPAGLALSAGTASASPTDDFYACATTGTPIECLKQGYSAGTIDWNGVFPPSVSGSVVKPVGATYTVKVTFDAFIDRVGGTRVDSDNRAVTPSDADGKRPFGFAIGQGYVINRIKVTVCVHQTPQSPPDVCGHPEQYYRPE
jgi:hypothetical protein